MTTRRRPQQQQQQQQRRRIHRPNNFTIATLGDACMYYILGPTLITFATCIISGLAYAFFKVVIPLHRDVYPEEFGIIRACIVVLHAVIGVYILVNIIFNYFMCVSTKSGHTAMITSSSRPSNSNQHNTNTASNTNTSITSTSTNNRLSSKINNQNRNGNAQYADIVRALASATNFQYPETVESLHAYRQSYIENIQERRRQREEHYNQYHNGHGNGNGNGNMRPNWTLQGAREWGFCANSNQPKPPRAHFDYVTRSLVLNMDHYCPWMFNTVGYFNYRYFVSFLIHVMLAMVYLMIMVLRPFLALNSSEYRQQIVQSKHQDFDSVHHLIPYVPTPEERSCIGFMFMMSAAVGISVGFLCGFHIYLILTAQTTIEFNSKVSFSFNWNRLQRTARIGNNNNNPYDLGWKQNWRQVFGPCNSSMEFFVGLFVPSSRKPVYLPIPISGVKGLAKIGKHEDGSISSSSSSEESSSLLEKSDENEEERNTVELNAVATVRERERERAAFIV